MENIKVIVKWNTEIFEDVDLCLSRSILEFKEKLSQLTGVPVEKQKLMSQKGILKDNVNLKELGLKQGSKIVLVGTAEGHQLKLPTEKTIFLEDLTSDERAKIFHEKQLDPLPVGLENLGNTCYLNSIIHMLRSIPSFLQILRSSDLKISEGSIGVNSNNLTVKFLNSFKNLMKEMDGNIEKVIPSEFVSLFRSQFPQYNIITGGPLGTYQQQDAEEVLGSLLTLFANELNGKDEENQSMKDIFRFRVKTRFKNTATDKEEIKMEDNYKLMCHMGTQLNPVDYLTQGIRVSLDEMIEKNSPETGIDTIYHKISEIDSLPSYLIVHLVRFEWKKSSEIARTEATRAKVCRKIEFSRNLDIYEFCSEDLKNILKIGRDLLDKKNQVVEENKQSETNSDLSTECPTGIYELECIVTHQGRTADSGHYVAWRYCPNDREYIIKFDDDKVSKIKVKDIDLSGGRSDYHIAIMLLYKKTTIRASEEDINSLFSK